MNKQEALDWLAEQIEAFGLDEDEADNYVKEAMQRLGFKMRQTIEWDEPEGSENGSNVSFFSGGNRGGNSSGSQRQQRPQRQGGNPPMPPRRAAGGTGQYPNG